MKQPVRHTSLVHASASIIVVIGAAAVCAAQLVRAYRGHAWSVPLCAAGGAIAVVMASCLLIRFPFAPNTGATGRVAQLARRILDFIVWMVWWTSMAVLVTAGLNWWRGTSEPLEGAAVQGAILGAGTLFLTIAQKRGWLRGVFVRPNDEVRARRDELAREREEVLARARQGRTKT